MSNGVDMKFDQLTAQWLSSIEQTQKLSTVANYRSKVQKYILPYFKDLLFPQITPEMIDNFKSDLLQTGLTAKYISNILSCFKVLLEFICTTYHYANPAISLSLLPQEKQEGTETETLSHYPIQELQNILWHDTDITKAGVLLVINTGIKIGELCALKWKDVDCDHFCINISYTLQRVKLDATTKLIRFPCSYSRSIPIPQQLKEVLTPLQGEKESYFLSGGSCPVEPRNMQYRLQKILTDSNLPRISFSALRKIFIQKSLEQGLDLFSLCKFLGVSTLDLGKIQSSKSSSLTAENKHTNYEIFNR